MTEGSGHERHADNDGSTPPVPDSAERRRADKSIAVVSRVPPVPGYGRPRWYQRLRSTVGLLGMVVICGALAAAAVAATLLALAVVVAAAFG